MYNRYFDNWEFDKILAKCEKDPIFGNKMFEEYLEQYPSDYYAYSYYAMHLIRLNQINKSERIIKMLENTNLERINANKRSAIKYNLTLCKMKIFHNFNGTHGIL